MMLSAKGRSQSAVVFLRGHGQLSRTRMMVTGNGNRSLLFQQKRNYMDVHQRPSHSGMFKRDNGKVKDATKSQQKREVPDPEESSTLSFYGVLFHRALLAVGLVYVTTEYVGDLTLCEGPSMFPTIQPSGEIVWIDKFFVRWAPSIPWTADERIQQAQAQQEEFEKQQMDNNAEVDVWYEPRISVTDLAKERKREKSMIARWSAAWQHMTSPLAIGDVVVIHHPSRKGTVCKRVTGLPGDQVLVQETGKIVTVPDGHLWLEGDNPGNSSDSRNYGPVPASLLVGRVLVRVWPIRSSDVAWMIRGSRPYQKSGRNRMLGSTVLPAGYEGQEIIKTIEQQRAVMLCDADTEDD